MSSLPRKNAIRTSGLPPFTRMFEWLPAQYKEVSEYYDDKAQNYFEWAWIPLLALAALFPLILIGYFLWLPVALFSAAYAARYAYLDHQTNKYEKKAKDSYVPSPSESGLANPDAGPDECPICGVDDLDYWRAFDAEREFYEAEDMHVVIYGPEWENSPSTSAHRDCAITVPSLWHECVNSKNAKEADISVYQRSVGLTADGQLGPRSINSWAGRDAFNRSYTPGYGPGM